MEESKNKQKINNIVKVCLFIGFGFMIFFLFQKVLSQSYDSPYMRDNVTTSLNTFYSQQENVDQVLFMGTSHSEYGVSPMEIYEDSGIVSYNLSTSGQPIEVTYYLLKSALETQSPEVVFLDASSLFFGDSISTSAWRYVLDEMSFGETKIEMAREYSMLVNDTEKFDLSCEKDFVNALVPMFQYHTRWDELSEMDFNDVWSSNSFVTAGYFMSSNSNGSLSVEAMNDIVDDMNGDDTYYENLCEEEGCDYYEGNSSLYSANITKRKKKYLKKIQKLCESNNVTLVLTKYPTVANPIYYTSAWTYERSEIVKDLATEMGLSYLDFVYDIDYGFDNTTDFQDGGAHSNYTGAKKISLYLSEYLQSTFGLEACENETFEENRELYDKLTEVAELQLSRDCNEILDYIVENKDKYIVCISASDDMASGLGEEEITALQALGLKADFTEGMNYSDSYIAIIDQGEVYIERQSNRKISYKATIDDCGEDDISISILSSGYRTQTDSEIKVNGTDYSLNNRGINIVLIDAETQVVVMSKSIDTYQQPEEHTVNSGNDIVMLQNYWEELMK